MKNNFSPIYLFFFVFLGFFLFLISPHPASAALKGDLDSNNQVNAQDLQLEVNVILGTNTNPAIVALADLNGDGLKNASDLQIMVNIVLGIQSASGWAKSFATTPRQDRDSGNAVATDANGNVYFTGYFHETINFGGGPLTSQETSYPSYQPDIFLAKYSPAGTHLWSKRFGGGLDEYGYDLVVDGDGNVVVTGFFTLAVDFGGGPLTSPDGRGVFVAKFSPTGTHLWSRGFKTTGMGGVGGNGVAVDVNNNIFLTGNFQNSIDFGGGPIIAVTSGNNVAAFVVKFSASGSHLWSKGFSSAGSSVRATGIAIDKGGNAVVTGFFANTVDFGGGHLTSNGYDIFVAKYSSGGTHIWSKQLTGDGAGNVAIDSSDNIIMSGSIGRGESAVNFGCGPLITGVGNAVLLKLSAAGSCIWSKIFTSPIGIMGSAEVDKNNNILTTGYFFGPVDFGGGNLNSNGRDVFVAKYSSSGAYLWAKAYGGSGINGDSGTSIATDNNNNVFVTGYFDGDYSNGSTINIEGQNLIVKFYDIFLLKLVP